MTRLSIFEAAREVPDAAALSAPERQWSFADVAARAAPYVGALLAARPSVIAVTPRADIDGLLWLYAGLATGTAVLTLHERATEPERQALMQRAGASAPPVPLSGALAPAALPDVDPETPAVLIPTSGSTGSPQLVELSHRALCASAAASAGNLGWEPEDRWLLCLPLAHTGGLSIVTRCLLARRAVVPFDSGPGGILASVQQLRLAADHATLISLVPSVLAALLDAGFRPSPRLRAVLLGGAGCPPVLAQRAHAARVPLLTSYGLTETASQVITRRYAERFDPLPELDGCVSSGHPLEGVEIRLQAGCLALRTKSLFTRYVGQASAREPDGWFLTNDRVTLGTDGSIFVRGRRDDLIITGGENVDPLEVEAELLRLPGVQAACAFGLPSERFGAVVSALLVTSDVRLADARQLSLLLGDRLARHKHPRQVRLAPTLPLTASGKVDRAACRAQFEADQRAETAD